MKINGLIWFTRCELEQIDLSIAFINQHFFKQVTAAQLADDFCINIRKLQAGFRKRTGAPVHEYLLRVRLANAKSMLTDPDESVKSITFKTGFRSPSHFGQVFKIRMGMTPQEFRVQQIMNELKEQSFENREQMSIV